MSKRTVEKKIDKLTLTSLLLKRIHKRRRHTWWVHPINQRREKYVEFDKLYEELKSFPQRYFQYFRMTKEQFEILHFLIENKITKEDTIYRKCTRKRLAVRHLTLLSFFLIT
jgi:hypothetical protein